MGYLFIDESIHERAGFIIGAVVYADRSVNWRVRRALRHVGLNPGVDEFKSRSRMDRTPVQARLRESLRRIVHAHCSIGVVVAPSADRPSFGREVLLGLEKILSENDLDARRNRIYFDQGIAGSVARGETLARQRAVLSSQDLFFEQDSRLVTGLQLADLVAHTSATMLLERLGHVSKTVKAGPNSGYDPDWDIALGFALWAGIRYAFFKRPNPSIPSSEPLLDATCGLHIAEGCGSELREAALDRFGSVWVGCIH